MTTGGVAVLDSPPAEPPMVWDRGLNARHKAAMAVIKQGEDDRELLLSYVIWPTPMIEATLEHATRDGIAVPRYVLP